MVAYKDRTTEFKSCVEGARQRLAPAGGPSEAKRPLLNNGGGGAGGSKQERQAQRSEFARVAAKIGKDIQNTTYKLDKLAQLAKKKTMFDDRPVEISELTYIIKQDIASLNQQIAQLQTLTRSNVAGPKQVQDHNKNVVMMLQSKLADTSIGFKDVLEIRTQNMKASRARTEEYSYAGGALPLQPASDSPLYRAPSAGPYGKGKGKDTNQNSDFLALDLGGPTKAGPDGAGQMDGQMQMELVQGNDQYMSQRSSAIETIEQTMNELGQIFSQLANMVASQGEQITAIDHDTEEIATNVTGAQNELLKYYASISSNRWLMIKVFGVLILFFLVFVLVS